MVVPLLRHQTRPLGAMLIPGGKGKLKRIVGQTNNHTNQFPNLCQDKKSEKSLSFSNRDTPSASSFDNSIGESIIKCFIENSMQEKHKRGK
jgi:hypothetical protein